MAQQIKGNCQIARRIGRKGARWRGPDMPAGFCRAGRGVRRNACHQNRCARRLCRKGKTPACRQIQGAHIPPQFNHHPGKGRAARSLQPGLKHRRRIAALHKDDPCRIETKLAQTGRIGRAPFAAEKILPHPQKRLRRPAKRKGQDHADRGGGIRLGCGIEFMQRRPPDHQGRNGAFLSVWGKGIEGHLGLLFMVCSHSYDSPPRVKRALEQGDFAAERALIRVCVAALGLSKAN